MSPAYPRAHNHWMYKHFLVFAKHHFELDIVNIMLHINIYFIIQLLVVYNNYTKLQTTTQNQKFGFNSQISKSVPLLLLLLTVKRK